jgi:adhesin transport system outer membrane protein
LKLLATLVIALASSAQLQGNEAINLETAISRALASHPEIKKAERELKVSAAQRDSARSSYLPSLGLELSVGTARDKEMYTDEIERPEFNRDHNFYNSDLVATYNLFRGFSDQNQIGEFQETFEKNKVVLAANRALIRRDVVVTYFKVQLTDLQIKAEQEAKSFRAKQLTEVKNRNRAGAATKLEVLQAQYALKNTEPEIYRLENELNLAVLKLQQLLNLRPDKDVQLSDSLEKAFESSRETKTPELGMLYELALQHNFSLRELRHEMKRLQAELNAGQKSHWPTVDLRFISSSRAFMKDEVFDEDVRTYRGEIAVNIPLFSGLDSFSDRAAIHEKLSSQALDEKIQKDAILRDLTKYAQMRNLSYKEFESGKANLALANESIKQSRDLYEAGSAKLTDVLDAYTQKFTAVKNIGEAMFNHIEATAWIQFHTNGSGQSRLSKEKT